MGRVGQRWTTPNLTYSLENRDYRLFEIDPGSGQIKVGEGTTLDFETKSSYVFTVKVKDASNASDTVTVNISVANVEEDPEITAGPTAVDYAENGTGTVSTFTAADPEDDSARPRKPLAWSLEGARRSTDFTISKGGVLTFNHPARLRGRAEHRQRTTCITSTVKVTDSDGRHSYGSHTSSGRHGHQRGGTGHGNPVRGAASG